MKALRNNTKQCKKFTTINYFQVEKTNYDASSDENNSAQVQQNNSNVIILQKFHRSYLKMSSCGASCCMKCF